MKTRKGAQTAAILGAVAICGLAIFVLKMRGFMPMAAGGFSYLALLLWLWPRPEDAPPKLPDDVNANDFEEALARLSSASSALRESLAEAPAVDAPVIGRMVQLVDGIRDHHIANPAHVKHTRIFLKHALGRMVDAVRSYVDLSQRSAGDQQERLQDISAEIENFIPALERVDRACLENDFDNLEIDIDILNDQLKRRR